MGIRVLSEYYSDDGKRTATIYVNPSMPDYYVSVKNETGSTFTATFETMTASEDYADDWVRSKGAH
jgi:hypothetical protein